MRYVRGLAFSLIVFLAGCASTYTVEIKKDTGASYDGNQRTSGIVGLFADKTGFLVSDYFYKRYDALWAIYGSRFVPKLEGVSVLKKEDGPTWKLVDKKPFTFTADPGRIYYRISAEHLTRYLDMVDMLDNEASLTK